LLLLEALTYRSEDGHAPARPLDPAMPELSKFLVGDIEVHVFIPLSEHV
jgi:hypothetical protein